MRNGGSGGKSEFLEALIKCEGLGWERGGERGYSRCFTITCEEEKEERNKAGEEEERDVRRWRWRRSSPHPGQ